MGLFGWNMYWNDQKKLWATATLSRLILHESPPSFDHHSRRHFFLQFTFALRRPAITDKIQIPIYRGLTENDSRYYGLLLLQTLNDICYNESWLYSVYFERLASNLGDLCRILLFSARVLEWTAYLTYLQTKKYETFVLIFHQRAQYQDQLARKRYDDQLLQQVIPGLVIFCYPSRVNVCFWQTAHLLLP